MKELTDILHSEGCSRQVIGGYLVIKYCLKK